MKKIRRNGFSITRKSMISWIAVIAIMLSTVAPVLANEEPKLQISQWAILELNEGERYGIYPIQWYYDGFLDSISEERLNELLESTNRKLSELNLEKNENFQPIDYEANGTRESVLIALYNLLNQYEVSDKLDISQGTPIEYMQRRGIVVGMGNDLKLDQLCTVEQAVIFATRLVLDTYQAYGAGGQGFVWKVSKGDNTIYLLGSIHAGDTTLYPINQKLKDAFKESDTLIVEANLMDQEGLNDFIQESMYIDGTSLKDHVTKETYEKAMKIFDKYQLPEEIYGLLKPWRIANDLAVIASSESSSLEDGQQAAALGIDMYFITTAALTGKPIGELEGLKYQADLFNNLSMETQEAYLNSVLDIIINPELRVESDNSDLKLWIEQWYKGDMEGFRDSYSSVIGEEDEFSKMLFGKRDENIVIKLTQLLEDDGEGTYFVVIGAGHLVLKDMVIDQLINKGYEVEVIQ